jgi:hypothetical protein
MKRNIGIIFILFIIIVVVNTYSCYHTERFESEKPYYDCIISINVHEKFNFLLKQLKNIQENVFCNYAVILNCNDFMFEECNSRRSELAENIYIHEKPLNKRLAHGTLAEGIYNNMCYATHHFAFDFFIVASSRNMFTNELTMNDLNSIKAGKPHTLDNRSWEEKKDDWIWGTLGNSMLGKYYLERNQNLHGCAHEGLIFTENGCKKIIQFLKNNPEIKEDTFRYESNMEEFALQTISINSGEPIYYIGNGCCNEGPIGKNDPDSDDLKFMYKVRREEFDNRTKDGFMTCSRD